MAKGKKYNDDVKEKAYALFDTNNNLTYISQKLGIPKSTLFGWKKEYDARTEEDKNLAQLRTKKKEKFILGAWRSIELSQQILERRLARALEEETRIDELMLLVDESARKEGFTQEMRKGLLTRVAQLHCDDLGKLVQVLGTLYDKQALANKEATEILGGQVTLKKFEDF